jgi:hypothetical protein
MSIHQLEPNRGMARGCLAEDPPQVVLSIIGVLGPAAANNCATTRVRVKYLIELLDVRVLSKQRRQVS